MTDPAWVPDTRVIPAELDDEYEAATYPPKPTHFASVADQLDHATKAKLMELMHYGLGDGDART